MRQIHKSSLVEAGSKCCRAQICCPLASAEFLAHLHKRTQEVFDVEAVQPTASAASLLNLAGIFSGDGDG